MRAVTEQVIAGTKRADALENRLRILQVARAAFASDGIDVPLREIARRSEVGVATVYRHFPTKEALLAEAFADQMVSCSEIVEEGLAAVDPWEGFAHVVERLMVVHALDRGFARAYTSQLVERAQSVTRMRVLVSRASHLLREDFSLDDLCLALMANEGIRAETPGERATASRRLALLLVRSFRRDAE